MIAAARLLFAVLAVSSAVAGPPSQARTQRFLSKIGDCRVTALATSPDGGDPAQPGGAAIRGNSFLVQRGRLSVLIAPIPMSAADRASLLPGRAAPQAIVLTSLEARQPGALVDGGTAAFPRTSIFIDRALVDDPREHTEAQIDATTALRTYHGINRLHLVDTTAELMPGVRIAISPYRPRSESRVRIGCGPVTLMILPAREIAFRSNAVGVDRRDDRLPRSLASDAYAVALTDGEFPGIGRIFLEHDGYHWGAISARAFGRSSRRYGQVTVENPDEAVLGGSGRPAPGEAKTPNH